MKAVCRYGTYGTVCIVFSSWSRIQNRLVGYHNHEPKVIQRDTGILKFGKSCLKTIYYGYQNKAKKNSLETFIRIRIVYFCFYREEVRYGT